MIKDKREFVMLPAPQNRKKAVECFIERKKGGLFGSWTPVYHLYISDTCEHLLSSKKSAGHSRSSYYAINFEKKGIDETKGHSYLGKLRANFVGMYSN